MTLITYIVTIAAIIGTVANSLQKRWCFNTDYIFHAIYVERIESV